MTWGALRVRTVVGCAVAKEVAAHLVSAVVTHRLLHTWHCQHRSALGQPVSQATAYDQAACAVNELSVASEVAGLHWLRVAPEVKMRISGLAIPRSSMHRAECELDLLCVMGYECGIFSQWCTRMHRVHS